MQFRAAAGVLLAGAADLEDAADTLVALLLDPEDTYVTSETAWALIDRGDIQGLRLIARAYAQADDSTVNWLSDAVDNPQTFEELAQRRAFLDELSRDTDAAVASGADALRRRLPL